MLKYCFLMNYKINSLYVVLLEYVVMSVLVDRSFAGEEEKHMSCKENDRSCRQECNEPGGWQLRGSDWGCCGNYEGCCTYASLLCYFHDALCRCCDVGKVDLCGPTCKPEPDCWVPTTASTCAAGGNCKVTSSEMPCNQGANCGMTSMNSNDTLFENVTDNIIDNITDETTTIQSVPKTQTSNFLELLNFKQKNIFKDTQIDKNDLHEAETTHGHFSSDYLSDDAMEGSGETTFKAHL